jgi:signal transduction histidine kinase
MASNVRIDISRKIVKLEERRAPETFNEIRTDEARISIRDVLTVTIQDDGVGMSVDKAMRKKEHGNRMGLIGIQERLIALDGKLSITSQLYQGVKVEAEMDISAATVAPSKGKKSKLEREII